ncbi:MAG: hypothetical protein HYX92_02085 [Chloroflexi bacterium]|nr:hypothetical protein [Chloroflexota bacterium]
MPLTTTKIVLSPRAEKLHPDAKSQLAARAGSLTDKSICLVDNRKPNAGLLMESIAAVLSRDYAPRQITIVKKPRAGAALPKEVLEDIVAKYDAVVEGICS